jgi:uncharacterized protein YcbK (DUF882 family)
MVHTLRSARRVSRFVVASLGGALMVAVGSIPAEARQGASPVVETDAGGARESLAASLFGRSGKLRFKLIEARARPSLPYLRQLFGDTAVNTPGVYAAAAADDGRPFSLISLLPFSAKQGGRVGAYRVGFWPAERRRVRSERYANPDGFIRVTPETQNTYISEHFRLRDFLTKDQVDVWPKYLVLREDLVDKLELVIDELKASGVPVTRMIVMSGFRTPQYNARGVGKGGRAQDSRHQYGDAADVFVDNDGDGRMDDLNRDGRIDARDAHVIEKAVERVEARHPDLVGGVGLYRATRAHGPFAHVDVRGYRARWGHS